MILRVVRRNIFYKKSLPQALLYELSKIVCFFRVKLTKKVKKKYINFSAKKITHKLKISKWKSKGVVNIDGSELKTNLKAALILPDGKPETPTFLVFDNYEKILKWNRSLRFGISVCTLAEMIRS